MGNDISKSRRLELEIIADKRDAESMIVVAGAIDDYLQECHDDKVNSLARRSMTYGVNSVPLKELSFARSFIEGAYNFLPQRLLNDLDKIAIVQLMPTADGGMPHTRPGRPHYDGIICYPDFAQLFSRTTLIHELWHIHQRKHKDLWVQTLKRIGWTIWGGVPPAHLENARRYNPDTIADPYWVFNEEWLPIPIFKDVTRPNVADVEIWFYNVKKNYHIKRVPNEIADYFPGLPPNAYEHPYELTAYMLSESNKYSNSIGFKHLIESIGVISLPSSENLSNK
jgi:hypothetical protein